MPLPSCLPCPRVFSFTWLQWLCFLLDDKVSGHLLLPIVCGCVCVDTCPEPPDGTVSWSCHWQESLQCRCPGKHWRGSPLLREREGPMQYCSLYYRTLLLSPVTYTSGFCFCFGSLFILPRVISPLISNSMLGTYKPREFMFQCSIFLPFHTVHGVLKARILKWFTIPFSSGPHFFRTLHHDPSILGGLIRGWLSFIE